MPHDPPERHRATAIAPHRPPTPTMTPRRISGPPTSHDVSRAWWPGRARPGHHVRCVDGQLASSRCRARYGSSAAYARAASLMPGQGQTSRQCTQRRSSVGSSVAGRCRSKRRSASRHMSSSVSRTIAIFSSFRKSRTTRANRSPYTARMQATTRCVAVRISTSTGMWRGSRRPHQSRARHPSRTRRHTHPGRGRLSRAPRSSRAERHARHTTSELRQRPPRGDRGRSRPAPHATSTACDTTGGARNTRRHCQVRHMQNVSHATTASEQRYIRPKPCVRAWLLTRLRV